MPSADSLPQINDYHFGVSHGLLNDTIQLFIDCTYSREDYAKELQGLNTFPSGRFGTRGDEASLNDVGGTSEYDTGFSYPAIVSVYIKDEGCMYALLDEAVCRVIYVYLQFVPQNNVLFDEKYLPADENGRPTTLYSLPF